MLTVISPAKKLDKSPNPRVQDFTIPERIEESETLIKALRKLSTQQIMNLMKISDTLAELNEDRYDDWKPTFDLKEAKQAVLTFKGDVYLGLGADKFQPSDLEYAQNHLRILSGLHGILRPLDLIRPYRLEMGTRMPVDGAKHLYEFWGLKITHVVNALLAEQKEKVLVNLASKEYFKSIKHKEIDGRIIACDFKEFKAGRYKAIMAFTKRARGLMANYIIKNRIETPEDLKGFDKGGYSFNEALSTENNWMFTRGEVN